MDSGGIYLFDDTSGALKLMIHKGLSTQFIKKKAYFEPDSENIKLVRKGNPIYASHKNLGIQRKKIDKQENLKALAVIPIFHPGQAWPRRRRRRLSRPVVTASRQLRGLPPALAGEPVKVF